MRSKLFLVFFMVMGISACGSDSKPPLGKTCTINSDCNNPLSCTFGKCHEACRVSTDCPSGQSCLKGPVNPMTTMAVNVCQLPEDRACAYHSDCVAPLKCARDLKCRNECKTDVDCTTGQTCVPGELVCADPPDLMAGMLKNTIDGSVPAVRPGADAGAPVGGGDGGTAADVPSGTDVPVVPGPDGGAMADVAVTAGSDALPTTPLPVSGVMADKPIVRQGELGVIVTVTATGGGLTGPTNFDIGGCRPTLQDGATDTMFSIRVSCPHGTPIGVKELKFQTSKGLVTHPAVLTVCAITAGPAGKDENRGTTDQPFRSFKKALSVADKGDTIQLLDGTYDKDNGEEFKDLIPAGIVIQGQTAAGTKLIGPTDASIYADGIKMREAGDLTLKNLSLGFFYRGIYLDKTTNLTAENVKVTRARTQGIYVYTGGDGSKINFTGDDSEISDHINQAVYVATKNVVFSFKSKGTISSTYSYIVQLYTSEKAELTLDGATVSSTMPTAQALYLYDGTNDDYTVNLSNVIVKGYSTLGGKDKTVATITNSTFELPSGTGSTVMTFNGKSLTLTKATFTGGGESLQLSGGDVVVRGTTFKDYYYRGVQVTTSGKVDFGTMAQPGANVFEPGAANANSYAFYDTRPTNPNAITVSETTVEGNALPPGDVKGPVNMPKRWYVQTPLNVITVY